MKLFQKLLVASTAVGLISPLAAQASDTLNLEEMNGYLRKPQSYIKGTKMAFAGLRKDKDRASIILYLNQNSDNPLELP